MPSNTTTACVQTLLSHNYRIAFAESATAGRLASEYSLVQESGKILLGGIVCYDESVKCEILNIPQQFIDAYTAESAEVTKAMAESLATLFKGDILVGVTGLASPGGSETKEKPVGTMFIHILTPNGYTAHREIFEGNPESIIMKAIDKTGELIMEKLKFE